MGGGGERGMGWGSRTNECRWRDWRDNHKKISQSTVYRINANFRNIAQFCVFFTITYTPQNIQYIEIISGIVSYWLN